MDNYILDENNCPRSVNIHEYMEWHATIPEEIKTGFGFTLARDEDDEVTVSTVFLGHDMRYDEGEPILWETMVFGGPDDQEYQRYSSKEDALTGHKEWCEKYLNKNE